MTLDEYRDCHLRISGTPHDRYELESYLNWREDELECMWLECQEVLPDIRSLLTRIVEVLKQDPRR